MAALLDWPAMTEAWGMISPWEFVSNVVKTLKAPLDDPGSASAGNALDFAESQGEELMKPFLDMWQRCFHGNLQHVCLLFVCYRKADELTKTPAEGSCQYTNKFSGCNSRRKFLINGAGAAIILQGM